mgnify:CR=1 FL=1
MLFVFVLFGGSKLIAVEYVKHIKKTNNGDLRICEQGGKFIIEIYEGTEYYSYKYCGTLEEAKEEAKLLQKKYHYL